MNGKIGIATLFFILTLVSGGITAFGLALRDEYYLLIGAIGVVFFYLLSKVVTIDFSEKSKAL